MHHRTRISRIVGALAAVLGVVQALLVLAPSPVVAQEDPPPAEAPAPERETPEPPRQDGPPVDPAKVEADLVAGSGAGFHALVPFRLLDSRTPNGGFNGKVTATTAKDLVVTGRGGVPASASAVIMNVTATGGTAGSFLTVFPAGGSAPNASNLNFGTGQTIPNLVTVKVGAGGKVTFKNAVGAVDVVADVVGYYDDGNGPGDSFFGVNPARILDSRGSVGGFNGKLAAGATGIKHLPVRGQGGVPQSATAVVMNVTATNASAGSFLQVWPTGTTQPTSSSLNFGAGETIPNLVVVQLGTGGQVSMFNAVGAVDVVADVVAFFDPSAGARFNPLPTPARILDDRVGNGLSGPWAAGQTRTLQIIGRAGIPVGATGLVMNTTVTNGTAPSFVTVFPNGTAKPNSSNLNFGAGQTIPNLVMGQVPASGKIDIANVAGSVDIIGDAVGYFAPSSNDVIPPDPTTTAPPPDPTESTSFSKSTEFLYTGPNRTQTFVTPGVIVADRSSVIRGRVLDKNGAGLAGVRVTAPTFPEIGRTVTRNDGRFDFVVNAAGTDVLLQFQKTGLLPAQRAVAATAGDFTTIPDVVLLAVDTKSTVIAGNSNQVQTAQSSPVTDDDGTRHNTLLFPAGTKAKLRLPDGSQQDLPTLTVRATEYTVGPNGPKAMPGDLPPNSAYTYAVELSVDEALAVGATTVDFDKPVVDYVENFVGFPTGSKIPTGYYDRATGSWVAVKDGRTVKILAISGGKVDLDITGDDAADPPAALATLGIDDAERTTLATLFPVGTSLWRTPISHFSPWDMNHPYRCRTFCTLPSAVVPPPKPGDDKHPSCTIPGSIISCEAQSVGERIPIVGSTVDLAYDSSTAAGYRPRSQVVIPVTGATLPPDITKAAVEVEIAGRFFELPVPLQPNQTITFAWDGLDGYKRPVVGEATAKVSVRYEYAVVYAKTQAELDASFGSPSTGDQFGFGGDESRGELRVSTRSNTRYELDGARRPASAALGGWGIDEHHDWQPQEGTLFLGTGQQLAVPRSSGATNAGNTKAFAVAAAPDGAAIITTGTQINRRALDGTVTKLAGTGSPCVGSASACDEGALATNARLNPQQDVALGPDGTIWFVDGVACSGGGGGLTCFGGVVRHITADGTVHTVAGNGAHCVDPLTCGDGVAATSVPVSPSEIAVDGTGTLWINEGYTFARRIRTVDRSGIIRTQYGCLADCDEIPRIVDGRPAANTKLFAIDIAIAPDGSLLVLESGNFDDPRRVVRIGRDGIAHVLAGDGPCPNLPDCGENGPAKAFRFRSAGSFAVDPTGAITVLDFVEGGGHGRGFYAWRFEEGGPIRLVAGAPGDCFAYVPGQCGDGNSALNAMLSGGMVAAGRNGLLYIAQQDTRELRVVGPELRTPDGFIPMPSEDASSIYVFDEDGRHMRTVDGTTGVTLRTFGYDAAGRLISVADADGNTTTIQRAANGDATGITAPRGIQTGLTLAGNKSLASVAAPGGATTAVTMGDTGLLTSFSEPGPAVHTFTYDADGRLTKDQGPLGRFTTLARSTIPGGSRVTATTSDGLVARYDTVTDAKGVRSFTHTDPSGAVTTTTTAPTGNRTTTAPDGTVTVSEFGVDPRWGLSTPVVTKTTETVPGGLVRTTTFGRSFVAAPGDITKVQSQKRTVSTDGRTTTTEYTAANRTQKVTTPSGNVWSTVVDAENHVVTFAPDGALPATYTYRPDGLVTKAGQGTRSLTYEYDAQGRRIAVIDAAGRRIDTTYDARHTVASQKSSGLASPTTYTHDERGNLTALSTPSTGTPGAGAYTFGFDLADQQTSFTIPGSPAETDVYSSDGRLTKVTTPEGSTIDRSFDAGGRLTDVTLPGATIHQTYVGATDRVATTASTGGGVTQTDAFTYQGALVTGHAASGAATGTFTTTWTGDQRLASLSLASGADSFTEAFTYDADGLVVADGPFTIGRAGPGGRPSAMGDGTGQQTVGYDLFGTADVRALDVGGTATFREQLTRDASGRITTAVVTTPSGAHTHTYTYDGAGRLASWKVDNGPVTTFAYDQHGNRTSVTGGAASYTATDRLTTVGATSYTYDANGNLTGRGADSFGRDATGELRSATVGGVPVDYRYDAQKRRVARVEAGATTEYLYGDPRDSSRVTASREGGVLTSYTYDDDGRLVAFERSGQRFYVGADHARTPRVVRNAAGDIVKELDYDPWGRVLADSNPGFPLVIGFGGGVVDSRTGWVRLGVRDYDPTTSRFTSVDPIGFLGGANLYGYAGADPINLGDPSGLKSIGLEGYFGFGGGVEVSWGSNGWTVCFTVGYGIGANAAVDPSGTTAAARGAGIVAGFSEGDFLEQVGANAEYFVDDCGNRTGTGTLDAQIGPLQGHLGGRIDAATGSVEGIADVNAGSSFPPSKAALQARVGVKYCREWK